MELNVQQTPQAPSYQAEPIQVPANIATPQNAMSAVKSQQEQLSAVNTLTGGSRQRQRRKSGKKNHKTSGYTHKSFIRTYKGRKYNQQGGSTGERIPVPQVGAPCSGGTQCAGAQNANFTAINNQAQSSSINDAYVSEQSGGRRKTRQNKNKHRHVSKKKSNNSISQMISNKIKKVIQQAFS